MLMLQAMQPRAVSSHSSHPYLCSLQPLPQALQKPSEPPPEIISRKLIGILLTLLNTTLTRAFLSVDSKRLTRLLTRLESTLTRNQGGPLTSAALLPAICVTLLILPSAKAQQKTLPAHPVSRIMVYESSQDLHE